LKTRDGVEYVEGMDLYHVSPYAVNACQVVHKLEPSAQKALDEKYISTHYFADPTNAAKEAIGFFTGRAMRLMHQFQIEEYCGRGTFGGSSDTMEFIGLINGVKK
jgi:hypothetical protein